MFRSRLRALVALPCVLVLTACESSSVPVLVKLRPGAALLLPCLDPALVANPETATDSDIALERIRVAQAYVDCRQRHADLARWVTEQ